jgi:hypothetical protein
MNVISLGINKVENEEAFMMIVVEVPFPSLFVTRF